MKPKYLLLAALLVALAAIFAACATDVESPVDGGEELECPDAEPCPECESCPEVDAGIEAPFEALWAESGHNDTEAEAFNHWNEDDPLEVPASCAKCHSTPGYLDFLGADGTEAGAVDNAAPIGTTITCEACHNDATVAKTSVVFPSGAEITGLGPSARCMECHQGRASSVSVDNSLAELGLTEDLDTVSADLGFINIHYFAAAGSLYGSEVHAGYEYAGNAYQIRFAHVEGYQECVDCHNPHTLELKLDECALCHESTEVETYRMAGSLADYDGDGDMTEGVYFEIETLREMLYSAIQAYASEVAGAPVVYDSLAYPYFFNDTNGDGEPGEDEANYGNRYASWTGRLLQAAYNFQVASKDPGAFAHNAKYHIALLYDSIASLNEAVSTPVDLSAAHRNDPGHFDGTAEAFRHWDEDPNVSGRCARCHSADGLPLFLSEGVNIGTEQANAFMCTTCHDVAAGFPARYVVDEMTFPSGATVTFGEGAEANLCIACHQGRESGASVDRAVAGYGDNEAIEGRGFINVHYFPAGATMFGADVNGAYQFAGKEYVGQFAHVNGFNTCVDCHNVHALEVEVDKCETCHGSTDPYAYRIDSTDWDGDGDTTEGIAGEVETMADVLYAAMQTYSEDAGAKIVYDSHSYPYFFNEAGERYSGFTPNLLRAAYNYQYAQKDPGAFAHNGKYVIQILFDSIDAVGGDVSGMTRP